jgi:hypothetical protein
MGAKGLFNKVKNRPTRRRYVVSTIKKAEDLYETAVFETNFFFIPRHWSRPDLTLKTHSKDDAWDLHYRLAARLLTEFPVRVFEECRQ